MGLVEIAVLMIESLIIVLVAYLAPTAVVAMTSVLLLIVESIGQILTVLHGLWQKRSLLALMFRLWRTGTLSSYDLWCLARLRIGGRPISVKDVLSGAWKSPKSQTETWKSSAKSGTGSQVDSQILIESGELKFYGPETTLWTKTIAESSSLA